MKKMILFGFVVFLVFLYSFPAVNSQSSGVCCLETNGYCSSNKEEGVCRSGGGNILGPALCYNPDGSSGFSSCKINGCIFSSGRCNFMPVARCQFLGGKVNPGIVTQEQCDNLNVPLDISGCCVSQEGSCSVSSKNQCKGKGDFYERGCNKLLDRCKNQGGEIKEKCSEDGRSILRFNDFGIQSIEEFSSEVSCVMEGNKIVRKSTSCKKDEKTLVVTANLDTGVPLTEEKIITQKMLGAFYDAKEGELKTADIRKNGESWCIIYGTEDGKNWDLYSKAEVDYDEDLRIKFSAGQRHAVYSCKNGNIVVEQGDLFRAKKGICVQNDENQFYVIGTKDEEWASCKPHGIFRERGFNELERAGKFRDEVPAGAVGARTRGVRAGANLLETARANYHQGFSQAVLIDNYEFTQGCEYPRFSVGGHFYSERVVPEIAPQLKCGECGKGFFNRCDKSECFRKGDCSFKGRGFFGIFKGCVAGAAIAEVVYLTAGSAGLHAGGGWGTIFATAPVSALPAGTQSVIEAELVTQTALTSELVALGSASTVVAETTAVTTATTVGTLVVKKGGASMASQIATYMTAAATADQIVMTHFNNPRNIRDAPSVESNVVGELGYGQNVQIVERRQDGNNIWGETVDGNWILLNSPDGTNPATLSRRAPLNPADVKKD